MQEGRQCNRFFGGAGLQNATMQDGRKPVLFLYTEVSEALRSCKHSIKPSLLCRMYSQLSNFKDTIAAIATPVGVGGIGVIRVSGDAAYDIVQTIFPKKELKNQAANTLHVGLLRDGDRILDEVVLSLFKKPHSFTGEDVIEISCHGSPYVMQEVLDTLIRKGARLAGPGEFSQRAFLNGKLDLAQAEAVADVINAESEAAHKAAISQMRGGFSKDLNLLRERLIHFVAMLELELDFSDEDVAFADRTELAGLVDEIHGRVNTLIDSFRLGNVIKKGVSVAIIGKPNAGKSTLLNALLNEERAIVSDIAGTTRDTIEEALNINGILFRLIDTAGIREHSTDQIEHLGMARSRANAEHADLIIHVVDPTQPGEEPGWMSEYADKSILVYNKADLQTPGLSDEATLRISARSGTGIETLRSTLYERAIGSTPAEGSIVTNARHHAALRQIRDSLEAVKLGLDNHLSGDLLTVDVRRALYFLGEITGQVEIDRDILGTIFGKFCIGK